MNKIHLSEEQRQLCIEFATQSNRPTPKEYDKWIRRMEKLTHGRPPKHRRIPHVIKGFDRGDVKLEPDFDALVDLPEGWAVFSHYDSGGNHGIESAGLTVMRNIYNSWAGRKEPSPKSLEILHK